MIKENVNKHNVVEGNTHKNVKWWQTNKTKFLTGKHNSKWDSN